MRIAIPNDCAVALPAPTAVQLAWQRRELGIFVHFGINTFTGREWGDGTESPSLFNPSGLDPDQWVQAAKEAGTGHVVLTAKHHDGFCLWPSRYTDYSVRRSPWQGGRGDVVRLFVDACRRHGIKPGLYLSPWNRHEPTYGDSAAYNQFYLNQLRELLTDYGELAEIWFDGACGEGPSGRRQEYDWAAYFALCKQLQPNAVTFGDGGMDVRWVGNERGYAGEPNWGMVDSMLVRSPGDAGADQAVDARARRLSVLNQLQHGDESGDMWRPAECDVSIRPGWFYHAAENDCVRTVQNLVDLYFKSVGRNAGLLLNIPPTPDGIFHPLDVERLRGMRAELDRMFQDDLTAGAEVIRIGSTIRIVLPAVSKIDTLRLAEAVEFGQRIRHYRVSYCDERGQCGWLLDGDTVGVTKLDRFVPVSAKAIQVDIVASRGVAALSDISAFKTS